MCVLLTHLLSEKTITVLYILSLTTYIVIYSISLSACQGSRPGAYAAQVDG